MTCYIRGNQRESGRLNVNSSLITTFQMILILSLICMGDLYAAEPIPLIEQQLPLGNHNDPDGQEEPAEPVELVESSHSLEEDETMTPDELNRDLAHEKAGNTIVADQRRDAYFWMANNSLGVWVGELRQKAKIGAFYSHKLTDISWLEGGLGYNRESSRFIDQEARFMARQDMVSFSVRYLHYPMVGSWFYLGASMGMYFHHARLNQAYSYQQNIAGQATRFTSLFMNIQTSIGFQHTFYQSFYLGVNLLSVAIHQHLFKLTGNTLHPALYRKFTQNNSSVVIILPIHLSIGYFLPAGGS
ncbi:MAG: hypothetical protein OXC40_01000 [Proteobacteria bacterium]|nr:hypothetical protein [Pseudomonadota bacterium]